MAHDSSSVQPAPARASSDRDKGEIDRIVETILYLYTESRRVTKTEARARGLTGPQLSVLKILEATGDLSLTELSERMSAKNSTITGIVDRMERDGLVVRDRSSTDRRVILIRATAKGLDLARSVPVSAMELFTAALASLAPEEQENLRRLVLKVAERVREEIARRRDDDEPKEGG